MTSAAAVPQQYPRSHSRDFCNSFWGPADDGINILLSRMRGATKTTEEIRRFWIERAVVEEQYATRLLALSKFPLGGDETGELLNALETLRKETEIQANSHSQLAQAIRTELETLTSHFFAKQANHRKNFQAPVEKKFKMKQTQESYVIKAREKYEGDCARITSYAQQATFVQGKDLERLQAKLKRAQQTVQANEQDLANFTQTLQDFLPTWETEWKEFCDRSQDLEEDRLDFMLNTMWSYANEVSQLCVNDDQSCERIRTALEQLDPAKELAQFIAECSTGNQVLDPPVFIPYNPQDPASSSQPPPTTRLAQFTRISRKASNTHLTLSDSQNATIVRSEPSPQTAVVNGHPSAITTTPSAPHPPWSESISQQANVSGHSAPTATIPMSRSSSTRQPQPQPQVTAPQAVSRSGSLDDAGGGGVLAAPTNWSQPPPTGPPNMAPPPPPEPYATPSGLSRPASPRRQQRASQPLPTPQHTQRMQDFPPMPIPPPPSPPPETSQILFYVRALFDYTATIDEEFSFQAGDIIAVTATPDDGWWSGELLDEARKETGRHVFPSNFVELF